MVNCVKKCPTLFRKHGGGQGGGGQLDQGLSVSCPPCPIILQPNPDRSGPAGVGTMSGAGMELTPWQAGAVPGEPAGLCQGAGGAQRCHLFRRWPGWPRGPGVAVPACPSCRCRCNNELSVCTNEIVLSVKGSFHQGDGRASDCVAKEKHKENCTKTPQRIILYQ